MSEQAYYPIFADLTGRRCVVVGGGKVAERKVARLLRCGARVTVISPTVTRRLSRDAQEGKIRRLSRPFRVADLTGAWLVYAATDDQRVNGRVSRSAAQRRIFTNVVDQTPLCSFIAPAILQRGTLTIAISTGGASPSLAKQVRRDLERTIGEGYLPMLRLLTRLRGVAKQRLPSFAARRRYFGQLLAGRVFELVKAGKPVEARREAERLLNHHA